MKTRSCNLSMVLILLFGLVFGPSCSNDTDLLRDTVLLENQIEDGIVVNDYFVVQPDSSIILDVLTNDGFTANDHVQIIEISNATYGFAEINDDNLSIVYSPQIPSDESTADENEANDEGNTSGEESAETEDTFTYTAEVENQDGTSITAVGTVEIVIVSSEEEDTTEENEDTEPVADTVPEGEEEEEETNSDTSENHSATLLFSSGFEGVSLTSEQYDYRYIQGTDSDTNFSWPPKILGSTGTEQEPSGIHVINDGGNSKIHNRLETVIGHHGNETTALFQGIDGTAGVTQTPYQINNIKENPDELYVTYWMKIDNTSLSGAYKWRALWEYKTEGYGTGDGFRMIAFIYTDDNGKAYWNFQGDRNPSNALWEKHNKTVPVPREEWFKVEYYFKWSEGLDGKAFMKVNGQLVGEHQGPTTANSKNLDFMILTQVYGDTSPMHQWVDDIEIWDGLPY